MPWHTALTGRMFASTTDRQRFANIKPGGLERVSGTYLSRPRPDSLDLRVRLDGRTPHLSADSAGLHAAPRGCWVLKRRKVHIHNAGLEARRKHLRCA